MKDTTRKLIVYGISVILMIVSFLLPPMGVIHPSVLMGVALLIGGHEWLFGNNIKEISIDKEGVHITTHSKED